LAGELLSSWGVRRGEALILLQNQGKIKEPDGIIGKDWMVSNLLDRRHEGKAIHGSNKNPSPTGSKDWGQVKASRW
jgi:hypothetical protein